MVTLRYNMHYCHPYKKSLNINIPLLFSWLDLKWGNKLILKFFWGKMIVSCIFMKGSLEAWSQYLKDSSYRSVHYNTLVFPGFSNAYTDFRLLLVVPPTQKPACLSSFICNLTGAEAPKLSLRSLYRLQEFHKIAIEENKAQVKKNEIRYIYKSTFYN